MRIQNVNNRSLSETSAGECTGAALSFRLAKIIKKGMRVMRKVFLVGFGIIAVGVMAGTVEAADPFTVGEKWTYKHEGAVPMRPPGYTITGDRVREVLGVQGESEKRRWSIREQWGDDDEWAGERLVCAERLFDKMEARGGEMVTTVDPAYPFDFLNLKPGEEKKLKSTFQFGEQFSFPIEATAKRVKDETVKVPAGEFENCVHIECEETVTFSPPDGDEMKITTKREQWYHPKVNGMVKEIYTTQTFNGGTNKGTSELKSYSKEKKK